MKYIVQYIGKYTFVLALFLGLIQMENLQAQNYQPFKQSDQLRYNGYQFSIFPGTEAWKKLDMNADKHALLQIPDDTLAVISTQRLLETCLYYPLMIEMFSFDNPVQGFNYIRKKFNGFDELFRRSDAGLHLLSYYRSRNPASIRQFKESVDRGCYSLDFVRLELMLAQPEIIKQLSPSQIREFIISNFEKADQQAALSQYYSRVFIPVTAVATGRMLLKANAFSETMDQSKVSKFIEEGVFESPGNISQIFEQAQIFIDENK